MEKKTTRISWDWKGGPSQEDLQIALKPFGVLVTENPGLDGSDSYGYIFSNRPLTPKEVREIALEED
jgi:hypothetical protein